MYYSDFEHNRPQQEHPIEATAYRVEPAAPAEPPRGKKSRLWPKVTALCLVCALAGGLAGGGAVTALMGGGVIPAGGSAAPGANATTIYQGDTPPTVVNVANVTGKEQLTASQIYATYVGSTVGITTELVETNFWGQEVPSAAAGSGFVISQDGYIVTNYHVIDGAKSIEVAFVDGKTYDAELVGGDEENDLAVLKIDATGLTPVIIGSSDNLVVGETVVAIGNPLGELTYSMTQGIVSALDRNVTMSDGRRMNYIQTDTAINSGNSGGALFNMYGQVVGIVSAKLSGSSGSSASIEGLGFAIPIDDVGDMIRDIMEHGYVTGKPYMGIINSSVSGEAQRYGTPAGAYIMGVADGSCSEKAGLQTGDIITKIGDADVASSDDLKNAMKGYKAGDTADLTVIRDGEKVSLSITFDERTEAREQATADLQAKLEEEQQRQQYQQQQQGGGYYFPFSW